jgi:hypothetical protein
VTSAVIYARVSERIERATGTKIYFADPPLALAARHEREHCECCSRLLRAGSARLVSAA